MNKKVKILRTCLYTIDSTNDSDVNRLCQLIFFLQNHQTIIFFFIFFQGYRQFFSKRKWRLENQSLRRHSKSFKRLVWKLPHWLGGKYRKSLRCFGYPKVDISIFWYQQSIAIGWILLRSDQVSTEHCFAQTAGGSRRLWISWHCCRSFGKCVNGWWEKRSSFCFEIRQPLFQVCQLRRCHLSGMKNSASKAVSLK